MVKKVIQSCEVLPLALAGADIFLVGDSTMAANEKSYPLWGWGMAVQELCKDGVTVKNCAVGGRSSKSFITEKRWEKVLAEGKKGDFVLIQFGHNDAHKGEKNLYRRTDPATTYQLYLKIYIAEARARGMIPVLCTQTMTCRFDKSGKAFNPPATNAKYVEACRKVAEETKCDLLDLNLYAMEKMNSLGPEESKKFHMYLKKGESPNFPEGRKDSCHLRVEGAKFYAQAAVELAKKQKLKLAKLFK